MTDAEVLEKIKKGDERVIDFLYKKHYKMMVNLIIKNNGSEDEAKDVYQDALIVFWQKTASGSLVLSSKISTYLYSVCYNLWLKELERKGRHKHEEHDGAEIMDFDRQERIDLMNKCIQDMGETCRNILMLYYFDELSMSDIAEKMGFANADTAKTKKYKCKQELDKLVKSRFKQEDFLD